MKNTDFNLKKKFQKNYLAGEVKITRFFPGTKTYQKLITNE